MTGGDEARNGRSGSAAHVMAAAKTVASSAPRIAIAERTTARQSTLLNFS